MGKDKHQTQPGLEIKEISSSDPFDPYFPPELRGKRVSLELSKADKDRFGHLKQLNERLKDAENSLNAYLETGNPKHFEDASRNNIELFTLSFDRPESTAGVEYVEPREIFWTTVTHWSNLTRTSPRSINKEAKKHRGRKSKIQRGRYCRKGSNV